MFKRSLNQRQLRLCLGLFLALFILTASCNQSKIPPTSNGSTATNCNKIAIFLPETEPAPRWENSDRPELERKIAKKLINRVGKDKDLMLLYFNANGSQGDQKKQAELAFQKEVCLFIVGPVNKTAIEILGEAKKNKIPVIAYDRMIDDQDKDKNNYAPYYISFDTIKVGWEQGNYIAEQLNLGSKSKYKFQPKNNKYVMINGSEDDYNTKLLEQGFKKSLQGFIDNQRIKPIQTPFSEMINIPRWKGVTAAKYMGEVLKANPELKIAWVGNDSMASEIINQLEPDQKGNILITGQDGTTESLKNIKNNFQSMTVCKDSKDLAEKTALLVEALFKGEVNQSIPGLELGKLGDIRSKTYLSEQIDVVTEENFQYRVSYDKKGNILQEDTCKGKKLN
jgi:ABC-type xylose transport system, periplasmic component